MKLGYFCTLYTHFEMYTRMGCYLKIIEVYKTVLAQNTKIVLTKGGIGSSCKAIDCVHAQKSS